MSIFSLIWVPIVVHTVPKNIWMLRLKTEPVTVGAETTEQRWDFWTRKSWIELSLPRYLPSCPGRGGVNSTQLFSPFTSLKISPQDIQYVLLLHMPDKRKHKKLQSAKSVTCSGFYAEIRIFLNRICIVMSKSRIISWHCLFKFGQKPTSADTLHIFLWHPCRTLCKVCKF